MDSTLIAIALTSTVIGVAGYMLRRYVFSARRPSSTTDFDGGVVSQSWLVEHRAGKQDDRFS
jgi:hypothetical protein